MLRNSQFQSLILLSQRKPFHGAALLTVSLFIILGAWSFQLIGGLAPCPLCLEQRVPWYLMIVVSAAATFGISARWPKQAVTALFAIALALLVWAAYLGLYHAGVEYKWWPGPPTCTGGGAIDGSIDLSQLGHAKIPMCDVVPWSMAGISLAGFNFLFSLLGVGIATLGLLRTLREKS